MSKEDKIKAYLAKMAEYHGVDKEEVKDYATVKAYIEYVNNNEEIIAD